jgi:uncharacterized protein (TIGR02145 family)
VRNRVILSSLIVILFLLTGCTKKSTEPDELPKITFSSVNPTSGPPGTIITITEVGIPIPRESLTVVIGDIRLPAYTQVNTNVMVSCPLMEPGHYDIFLEHPKALKTLVSSFEVTEPPETGVPPGQIAEDLTNSVLVITQSLEISIETLKMRGNISDAQSDSFKATLNAINSIVSGASRVIESMPDSEKVILDQELTAAGLADLFGSKGHFRQLPSSGNAVREFLASKGEYDAFHGLILGDNISFALSAVKAALRVVNIVSAFGSLGLSAPANVALTTISFAIGAVDNLIDGCMPTDLYHVEMAVIPPDGSVFRIGETAQIEYWGSFRTQSGMVTTTISTFVNGVFSFMPAPEIDKLIDKIVGEIDVEGLEEILGNQQVIFLHVPVKLDISYYQKSDEEVLLYITTALSGILPGIQLLSVLSYAGVSFPGLAVDPLVIESDIVSVSDDRLSVTALQNGLVNPSQISMSTWVMNPICEGENSWWWTWICLGIELPEFLPQSAYTIPTIVIGTEPQPDLTPPGAILNLYVIDSTSNSVTLAWNAPGDDNYTGTATEYDIRFAQSPVTESNWDAANECIGELHPAGSGTPESFVVGGLEPTTLYYFAIKTGDEVPNWSELSNVASGRTTRNLDVTPPAAISNLMASNPTASSITLSWTAPGDDDFSGTASQYDIRYSTSNITESNWELATECIGEPTPKPSGSSDSFVVTGLNPNTNYYFALKASDEVPNWSGLSNVDSGKTWFGSDSNGTVTDIDGNIYQTIKIGNQWWMAENLKVTRYRNGEPIPNVTDFSTWSGLSTGAYCNYNNDEANVAVHGRLYNWYAVNDSRNIAPAGWHVPSDAEWQTLVDYLGGDAVAGGKMKEAGTAHWQSPNTGATNESGFTALPSGYRSYYGYFYYLGYYAHFWSSTEYVSTSAWDRHLHYDTSDIYRYYYFKQLGVSVRCVRD